MLRDILTALATELRSLEWRGPRGLEATEAAASVTLAVLIALLLHSDEPWWAAITAFMVTRVAPAAAVQRGAMRVLGSIVGAIAALIALSAVRLSVTAVSAVPVYFRVRRLNRFRDLALWLRLVSWVGDVVPDHADVLQPAAHGVHDGGRSRRRCHDRDHGIFCGLHS